MNTRKRSINILTPLLAVLLLTACGSVETGSEHAPVATDREITAPLPTPATVDEAVLVNLRPFTTSGLAGDAAWAPDGQSVAYTVLSAPAVLYREPPETQVWWSRADGSDAHVLAEGHSPLFSGRRSPPRPIPSIPFSMPGTCVGRIVCGRRFPPRPIPSASSPSATWTRA